MDSIILYIRNGKFLADKRHARKLNCQAARYSLLNGVFYRRGFTFPLLRCLNHEEADYVLREIYDGICGNHFGPWSLAFKALR